MNNTQFAFIIDIFGQFGPENMIMGLIMMKP